MIQSNVKSISDDPIFRLDVPQTKDCVTKLNNLENKINRIEKRIQSGKPQGVIDLTQSEPDAGISSKQMDSDRKSYKTVHINKHDDTVLTTFRSNDTTRFSRIIMSAQTDSTSVHNNVNEHSSETANPPRERERKGGPIMPEGTSSRDSGAKRPGTDDAHSRPDPPPGNGGAQSSLANGRKPYKDVVTNGRPLNNASLGHQQFGPPSGADRPKQAQPQGSHTETGNPVTSLSSAGPSRNDPTNPGPQYQIPVINRTSETMGRPRYRRDRQTVLPDINVTDNTSSLLDHIDVSEHVRKRTKRFYVGGFKSSITQDELIKYVESKGLTVTWVKIWASKRHGRVAIRLNVEATEDYLRVTEPGFWPRGIKCRPWLTNNTFKNKYLNTKGHTKRYSDAEENYYYEHDSEYQWNDANGASYQYRNSNGYQANV